jgi:hypothetical protein
MTHRRTPTMPIVRFRCIVSYRTARSERISTWRTSVRGRDFVAVIADVIEKLKRRQHRPVTVVGMYVHLQERSSG